MLVSLCARIGASLWRDALVALGLAFGPVVALGFSRFAYALLLPPMHQDLGWTYTQAGGINTANAAGYIIGAGAAAWAARRLADRVAFVGALVVSAAALLLNAATADYATLLALRFVGGISTAIAFVVGSGLAARIDPLATRQRSAFLLGIYFAGVGIGIVVAGVLVPAALAEGAASWPAGWLLMGIASVVALAPAWLAARTVPEPPGPPSASIGLRELAGLTPTLVAYTLFGAGYVSYMTFIVALLRAQGASDPTVMLFFEILGISSALTTLFIWGHVCGRLPGGLAPAVVSAVAFVGTLPVLLWDGTLPALVSAVIFGGSFMAGPTAVTVLARRILPQASWTAGISMLTVAFAVGQAVGPILSGLLSDRSGGLETGLWLSAVLVAISAAVSLAQREPANEATFNLPPEVLGQVAD